MQEEKPFDSKIEVLEKKLSIAENKYDQIEKNMEHYEKWYVEFLTKANKTIEEVRRFLAKFTDEDIQRLEKVVAAIYGE